jgi:HK97 family phage prohead protease
MLLNKFDNPIEECQLKFDDESKQGVFTGYASVFGGVDSYGDTITKGAFAETIEQRKRPVRMFYGHSPGRVIGKWLDMKEDDTGLFVRGEFTPGNTDAANVYASMKHGAVDGLSIGFRIPTGGAEDIEEGGRRINKIDLVEISVVSMPADDSAVIQSVKSIADEIKSIETIRDAELFLRDAGNFPRSMAKAFASQLRDVYLREADQLNQQNEALRDGREWVDHLVSTCTVKSK